LEVQHLVRSEQPGSNARIYCGVFLISLSVLMLELVLTRIFSVTMYYHFAFMAISLALFGSGASGVFVYLKSSRFTAERESKDMAVSSLAMALAILVSLAALLNVSIGLVPSLGVYLALTALYVVCAAPFFFAGVCLSLAMRRFAASSGKLYFFDLVGASAGCLLVIPALNWLGGPTAMLVVALIAATGAVALSWAVSPQLRLYSAVLVLVFAALSIANNRVDIFSVIWAKGSREKPTIFAKWNSFSRVTVSGDVTDVKPLWITIDSDAASSILKYSNNPDAMEYVEEKVSALAYRLKTQPKVLVIGPGGGRDVVTALETGSRDITAVEVNPIIINDVMLKEPYRSFSGNLYVRPEVRAVVDEGRSYVRGSKERFDIIQASLIDTWAANAAGAFALAENNLYTVEAFKLYMDHLTDDGVLTMTRWLLDPPQQELRLVSLAREFMAREHTPHPERHLCVFKAPGRGERVETSFILKKSEFTDAEVRTLEAAARATGCEPLYTPLTRLPNVFTALATTADCEAFYRHYPINVRPTFDDSPFFFYHVALADIPKAFKLTNESQKTNMGVFVLLSLMVIAGTLVLLFILGPLALTRTRPLSDSWATTLWRLLYFGGLGLGFIVIEMAMIQRFILFLGHPVYALAVVLFSLLFFSGIGSLLTSRVPDRRLEHAIIWALAVIIATALIYVVLLPEVYARFGGNPLEFRVFISIALLMPLALALGMPMPLGIRLLNRRAPDLIPWAWGLNGSTSVMGSVAAVIIAMHWGFNTALIVGSVAYLGSGLFLGLGRRIDSAEGIRRASSAGDEPEVALAPAGD
jgi:predicted membrane-bound spermidine synthase